MRDKILRHFKVKGKDITLSVYLLSRILEFSYQNGRIKIKVESEKIPPHNYRNSIFEFMEELNKYLRNQGMDLTVGNYDYMFLFLENALKEVPDLRELRGDSKSLRYDRREPWFLIDMTENEILDVGVTIRELMVRNSILKCTRITSGVYETPLRYNLTSNKKILLKGFKTALEYGYKKALEKKGIKEETRIYTERARERFTHEESRENNSMDKQRTNEGDAKATKIYENRKNISSGFKYLVDVRRKDYITG